MKISEIKSIIERTGLRPTRDRGQNFLIDESVANSILAAADVNEDDQVLEIGPGLGMMTELLIGRGAKVVAVELDRLLASELTKRLVTNDLQVIVGDFLELTDDNLKNFFDNQVYSVVANLPYSITSAAIDRLTKVKPRPKSLTLMVQREVAERICAKPPRLSVLSILVQLHGQPRIVKTVSPAAFWPKPKVESAVLHINLLSEEEITKRLDGLHVDKIMEVVHLGFSSRRKQLKNVLVSRFKISSVEEVLTSMGLDNRVRAENLSPDMWIELVAKLTR